MYDEDDDEFNIYPVEDKGIEKVFVWGCGFLALVTVAALIFF